MIRCDFPLTILLIVISTRFASITESYLYITGTKIGDMTALVSAAADNAGDNVQLVFNTLINDGVEVTQLWTENFLGWMSPSSNWLSSGTIEASAGLQILNSVNCTGTGTF